MNRIMYKISLIAVLFTPLASHALDLKSVQKIFVDDETSCAQMNDGQVKCWGRNSDNFLVKQAEYRNGYGGQPGDMADHLNELASGKDILQIAMHDFVSCLLFRSGKAQCHSGEGVDVRTKDLNASSSDTFFDAGNGEAIAAMRVGGGSICLVGASGRVKCAGDLYDVQDLSDRNNIRRNAFIDFGTTAKVKQLEFAASDSRHINEFRTSACALFDDGRVKCWGKGAGGVLGQGNENDISGKRLRDIPFIDFGKNVKIASLAKGTNYKSTCAVTTEGKAKCWGSNIYGELGLGKSIPGQIQERESSKSFYPPMGDRLPYLDFGKDVRVVEIYQGFRSFCAKLENLQFKCWGRVGQGAPFSIDNPIVVSESLNPVAFGSLHIVQMAMGSDHVCAILSNGGLKCLGRNVYGQLGLEDTETRGDTSEELGDALPYVRLWD